MDRLTPHAARLAAFVIALFGLLTGGALAQGDDLEQARLQRANQNYPAAAELYERAIKDDPDDHLVLAEAGDVYMQLEDYSRAAELYKRALDERRNAPEYLMRYGTALSHQMMHSEAIKYLRRAVDEDDESLQSFLALGRAYIRAGKDSLPEAQLILQTASNRYKGAADTRIALGDLYFAQRIFELAVNQYEQALGIDSSLIEPRVKLARAYREMAKGQTREVANEYYNSALRHFNAVTRMDPNNARAWLEQGEILSLAQEYETAAQSFRRYVELRPNDPKADISFARAAYNGNFLTVAVEPLERILERTDSVSTPFHPQARLMLAKAYYVDKKFAESKQLYGMVPDSTIDSLGYRIYAASALESDDTATAVAVYKRFIDRYSEDCDLAYGIGVYLYNIRRYDDAAEVLDEQIVRCSPTQATPYLYLGVARYLTKDYSGAITALNQAVGRDSANITVMYWLMNAYAANKQEADAAGMAKTMIRIGSPGEHQKELVLAYNLLGKAQFDAKNYKDAITHLKKTLELDAANLQANLIIALSYHFLQDKENACRYYNQTLKHHPGNTTARDNKAKLGC